MRRRRSGALLALPVTLMLVGVAWWSVPDMSPATRSATLQPVAPPPSTAVAPPPPLVAGVPVEAEPDAQRELDALAALYDRVGRRIRCDVGERLADGVYAADGAGWLQVHGGVLTGTVVRPSGEARLMAQLAPAGVLAWSEAREGEWGGCEVRPLRRVEVRGTLRHADGAPAEDFAVRGCIHGEFARTDAEGRWVIEGLADTTCHPMAFVETEGGAFGRTEPVNVPVRAPGPVEGIELVLPDAAEILSLEAQRALAPQLAHLIEARVEEQREVVEHTHEMLRRAGPDGPAAHLRRFVAHEEAVLQRMTDHLDRLDDPDEAALALRETWMNLY